MNRPHTLASAALAALLAAGGARGADLADWLKIDAFGTLGAYQADDAIASVRAEPRTATPSLKKLRLDGDSQITGQLTLNPTGAVRGVWQVLAKDDIVERFKPRTEWLYGAWDAAPGLNLKLGRTVLPAFLLSDTRNVAFSQTTVRPPNTVYQLNPITTLDGASAVWGGKLAGGDVAFDAATGKSKITLAAGTVDVKSATALAARWTRGGFTARFGHAEFKIDLSLPATEAALARLASGATGCTNCTAVFAAVAPTKGFKVSMNTLALAWEKDKLGLQAEFVDRPSSSVLVPKARAWYGQASYRLGAFTPYVVVGQLQFRNAPLGLTTAAAAPAAAAAANAAFDRYLMGPNDRDIWQLGVRWDFRENFALKLQAESFRHTRETRLGVSNIVSYPSPPPIGAYTGPQWDGAVRVLTLNLDFVF